MPTDATGTPTPLGIPKYNPNVDAPSGLGFNAAMDAIDTLIAARATEADLTALEAEVAGKMTAPSAPAAGDVPVWDGTAWVKSSATQMALAGLADGSAGDILAMVAGAWAGSKGLRRIFEEIPSANAVTQSISGIDQNYRHLLVMGSLNTNNAGSSQNISLRLNGGSTADYYLQRLTANGTSVAASESIGATSFLQAGYVDPGYQHGVPFVWFIPNYTFAGSKTIFGFWGVFTNVASGTGSIQIFTGAWRAGGAVTSLDLVGASGAAWGGMPANVITGFGIG